jgi:hypothetical protein
VALGTEHLDHPREESRPLDTRDGGVGLGEVLADIAHRDGPEQGVGERMADRVPVRMPGEARLIVEPHATQPQVARVVVRVSVEAQADARGVIHWIAPGTPQRGRGRPAS